MNPQIFTFNSQTSLSSLFPTVTIYKKYNIFVQLKNASSAKYEIENTVCHDNLSKYLTKYANIFVHVKNCRSIMDGHFYNLNDIIRAIDSKGEDMRIDANLKLNDLKVELVEQQTKVYKMKHRMISQRPSVEEYEEENAALSLLETQVNDLRELIKTGDELEHLSDDIASNISSNMYDCFKESDEITEGLIMLPASFSNKPLEAQLDEIFDEGLGHKCEYLDYDDILEYAIKNDIATDLCLRIRIQELETLTSNNNDDEDSVFDEEEEETSEWETESIDEKENPSVSTILTDLVGPIPKNWQPEDDEPLKLNECPTCSDYHILIQELNEKNKKIFNQKEIIDQQDKQIEEYDEKDDETDINDWKVKWIALSDCFDDEIQLKHVKIQDLEEIINEKDETINKLRKELTLQREKNKENNL